jgi:FkbM family methyltransferase
MSYSQNNEEEVILFYFQDKVGSFLDIGAFDGKTYSNTLKLVELGWSGTCIEPDPAAFKQLSYLHKDNKDIKLINAAFAQDTGETTFFTANGEAISTTSPEHKTRWEGLWDVKYSEIKVNKINLSSFYNGETYTFVNLDVESTNWDLLQLLPLDKMKTELICVEHDKNIDMIKEYCARFGLVKELLQNGENLILGR